MGYYVIGVGGTGAKCVESFIHLCASGLMPDARQLSCLFVDPDGANGSLKRTNLLLKNYDECRQLSLGQADLFKNELRMANPGVWSPFRHKPPRLDQFFNYNTLAQPTAHLFDVLYTPREKQTPLDYGFRGHPSIGAAAMAATVELGGEQPWDTFFTHLNHDISNGETPKVVLFGSIFGGTGAAGVPTISRLIGNEFAKQLSEGKLKLGSVLMLPYFSFDPVKSESLRVDADTFLLSTQTALEYYFRQNELQICNAVYLLGEETWKSMRSSSIGGEQQENEPHLLEVYAALGAIHFFENQVDGYPHIARATRDRTSWSDLPHGKGFAHMKQKIEQLARFAFAYVTTYHPMLTSINSEGSAYRAPWYVNLLGRKRVDLKSSMEKEFQHLKAYCESFLLWLANVEQSRAVGNGDKSGHLINFNAFAEVVSDSIGKPLVRLKTLDRFDREAFANLLLPVTKQNPQALTRLWERMSEAHVRDSNAVGVGRFVRALYDECGAAVLAKS